MALAVALAAACSAPDREGRTGGSAVTPLNAAERAAALAHDMIIVDTHIDVPFRLGKEMEDISQRTAKGDFDYPRAVAGGLDAPFMSIYVPSAMEEEGAYEFAESLIDRVEGFARDWPDKFALATSSSDVRQQFAKGLISLPMGMENGAPIEGDLDKLRHFAARGISYVTLTHAENNHICDSSYATEKTWHGLSPFGREVVAEMNRLGVMIDVSHVSDDTFHQVLELTTVPVIASHSSCRRFTPGWERNMSDDMIVELGRNGGVMQINFGSAFLNEAAYKQSTEFYQAAGAYAAANELEETDPAMVEFTEAWWREHPRIYADVSDVVAHIDNVVALAGIDHVGLGSDFDGVGDSLPTGLKDVSQYPNLIAALLEAGYSEEDIEKILGGNLLRVWDEVESAAAGGGA
jgi:membrane dipeptidase